MSALRFTPLHARRVVAGLTSLAVLLATGLPPTATVAEAEERQQPTLRFFHTDHLGSTTLVTDEEGRVVERIEYKPFGEVYRREVRDPATGQLIVGSAAPSGSPHGFTGQRHDTSTGLYYYKARYYDPSLGRFSQPDPFVQGPADPQTLNRYAYVGNNPTNFTDPSGHKKWYQSLGFDENPITHPDQWWDSQKEQWTNPWWWLTRTVPDADQARQNYETYQYAMSKVNYFLVETLGVHQSTASAITGGLMGFAVGGPAGAIGGAVGGYVTAEALRTRTGQRVVRNMAEFLIDTTGMDAQTAYSTAYTIATTAVSAAVALATYSANQLYAKAVGYAPTWAKGGAAVGKGRYALPVEGANNVGTQHLRVDPNGLVNEGGYISKGATQAPGINATAGLHDVFQVRLDLWGGQLARTALNFPGMPLAAAITYASLLYGEGTFVGIHAAASRSPQDN